ncbi:arsenate reductase/protein-tyrosine-phosphatase family protein [Nonomuraea sp. SBT364]|uniref:arsenate reductase/protein-tyrosine-phosphatase family protein n=1 Tax=Nonomuraea sp. SBT364 TaxID=1580530 RepID=UPI002F42BE1A
MEVRLFRSFDPAAPTGAEVPDPYYGGDEGFEDVLALVEAAAEGVAGHIADEIG